MFSRKVFDMGKMCLSENTAPQSPCSTLSFWLKLQFWGVGHLKRHTQILLSEDPVAHEA
jgi:hypothetical protein